MLPDGSGSGGGLIGARVAAQSNEYGVQMNSLLTSNLLMLL